MDTQPDETSPPVPAFTPPPQSLSALWSSQLQCPLSALHTWAPRGPPPGSNSGNLMGSPAPSPPLEIHRPRVGKCLTTYLLQPGAGLPRAIRPLFNTTASGAGNCSCPLLIPFPLLSVPLILLACKTPSFGAPAFLPVKTSTPLLPPPQCPDANPRWHFSFILSSWIKSQLYLLSLIDLTLLPLTCLGWACLVNHFLIFISRTFTISGPTGPRR